MLWIIASIPFWLIGGIILCVSGYALIRSIRTNRMELHNALAATATLFVIAGIFFIIAAKVAGA